MLLNGKQSTAKQNMQEAQTEGSIILAMHRELQYSLGTRYKSMIGYNMLRWLCNTYLHECTS